MALTAEQFPRIDAELLAELEKRFPDRLPTAPIDLDELRRLQGQREVVSLLRRTFDIQNKTILKGR